MRSFLDSTKKAGAFLKDSGLTMELFQVSDLFCCGYMIKPRDLGLVVYRGGDGRDRTDDLLNAIQALSQLSYAPKPF